MAGGQQSTSLVHQPRLLTRDAAVRGSLLFLEFPQDPKTFDLEDEWLVGNRLLAAPVLAQGGGRDRHSTFKRRSTPFLPMSEREPSCPSDPFCSPQARTQSSSPSTRQVSRQAPWTITSGSSSGAGMPPPYSWK